MEIATDGEEVGSIGAVGTLHRGHEVDVLYALHLLVVDDEGATEGLTGEDEALFKLQRDAVVVGLRVIAHHDVGHPRASVSLASSTDGG